MRQTRLVCLIAIGCFVALGGAAGSQGDGDSGGFTVREELKDQFTIALPEGWSVYDQGAAQGNVMGAWWWKPGMGMVIFSAEEIGDTPSVELLARIDTGEVPSFFVDRLPRFLGSTCAAFGDKAAIRVRELVSRSAAQVRGKPRFRDLLLGPPLTDVESKKLGGCIGVSSQGTGSGEPRWKVRVRAASDDNLTYIFTLRNTKENFARNIQVFDSAMATVRLSVEALDSDAPDPDPQLGAIAVKIQLKGPTAISRRGHAAQVLFVKAEKDVNIFGASEIIASNFNRERQVYLLNVEPGKYVAVGTYQEGGDLPSANVYFDEEMIAATEVTVEPGKIAFMGDIVVKVKAGMKKAGHAQNHYAEILGRGSRWNPSGPTHVTRAGSLTSVVRDPAVARTFWTEAVQQAFSNEPAWQELTRNQLAAVD